MIPVDVLNACILAVFLLVFLVRLLIILHSIRLLVKIKYVRTEPFVPDTFPPVSVLIAARNERDNLQKNLPLVLEQAYRGEFEVIVILDSCVDDSKRVILDLQNRYDHLKYTEVFQDKRFDKYKKMAILLGVKAAAYDHLVFIDADCEPVSEKWLERMATKFTEKNLILGYGGMKKGRGLLNLMQRYDTLYNSVLYFSSALAGKPYMAVGRNMAYHKELFHKAGGFKKHYHLPSGNDDLFVRDVADFAETGICIHPDSFVFTAPAQTFKDFFFKKIRHTSISYYYQTGVKIFLAADALSRFLFVPLLLFSYLFFYFNDNLFAKIVLLLGLVKFLAELLILHPIYKHFDEERIFRNGIWLEMLTPAFVAVSMLYAKVRKKEQNNWL